MPRRNLLLLALPLLLAACGSRDDPGSRLSFQRGIDPNAKVSLDLRGIKALIELPLPKIEADDFDMGGVKLYPGSTIDRIDIRAHRGKVESDRGAVDVRFTAPAGPDEVRAHFLDAMKAKAFAVTPEPQGVSGKDEEGDPIRVVLSDGAGGGTAGTITMIDRK